MQEKDFFRIQDVQHGGGAALPLRSRRVFFLGIGGVAMSALARFSHALGASVSGSDRAASAVTAALAAEGIRVFIGHRAENLPPAADLLVYTLAASPDLPEYRAALSRGVPAVSRAEYFGALMPLFRTRVGISGSHGKSTVTAMAERIFSFAYRYPTVFSGAGLSIGAGSSYRAGGRETLIYEACEYKDSFLRFSPTTAVALNLEWDHVDYFASPEALGASFVASLSAAQTAVLSADDPALAGLRSSIRAPRVRTYGRSPAADYRVAGVEEDHGYFSFSLFSGKERLCAAALNVPGAFQVGNAAAAIVCAVENGVSPALAASAVSCFSGIPRRMERIGSLGARPIYYDYAHHPTEIASVIRTVKELHAGPVTVLFRPHTYSRTRALFSGFVSALSLADCGWVLPIDAVREEPIPDVSAEALARAAGLRFLPLPVPDRLPALLSDESAGPILLLGAGGMDEVRRALCLKAL